MADKFCRQCGAPLPEGAAMCKYCLAPVEQDGEAVEKETGLAETPGGDGARATGENAEDGSNVSLYRIYGVLAYLSYAVLVPVLLKPNVKFVRFHINQGLVLFILQALLLAASGFAGRIPVLAMIVGGLRVVCLLLMMCGAVSALRGLMKPLPIVGKIHLLR